MLTRTAALRNCGPNGSVLWPKREVLLRRPHAHAAGCGWGDCGWGHVPRAQRFTRECIIEAMPLCALQQCASRAYYYLPCAWLVTWSCLGTRLDAHTGACGNSFIPFLVHHACHLWPARRTRDRPPCIFFLRLHHLQRKIPLRAKTTKRVRKWTSGHCLPNLSNPCAGGEVVAARASALARRAACRHSSSSALLCAVSY